LTGLKPELKRCFLAGLMTLVPLVITFSVLEFIVGVMDRLLGHLPRPLHPDSYLPWHIPGLGLALAVVLTMLVGAATRHYAGRRVVAVWESLVRRIPLVRGVYISTKQLLEAIFLSGSDSFKRAVLVEFPRPGVYAIGLVTGRAGGEMAGLGLNGGRQFINVYVPHTPNPAGGFFIAVPEEQTVPLTMSVEEALKMVISGGIVAPEAPGGEATARRAAASLEGPAE